MLEYKYNKSANKFTENGHTMFEEDVLKRLKRLSQLEEKLRWIPLKEQNPPEKIQLEFKRFDEEFVNICKVEELEGKLCLLASLGYGLLSDTSFTHWRHIL